VRRRQAELGGCDEQAGVRRQIQDRLAEAPADRYPSLTGLVPELTAAQDGGIELYEQGLKGLLRGLLGG
jgi:hypothetical protein